jgi:hypothetical protein
MVNEIDMIKPLAFLHWALAAWRSGAEFPYQRDDLSLSSITFSKPDIRKEDHHGHDKKIGSS